MESAKWWIFPDPVHNNYFSLYLFLLLCIIVFWYTNVHDWVLGVMNLIDLKTTIAPLVLPGTTLG